jgi:hypothetical protein
MDISTGHLEQRTYAVPFSLVGGPFHRLGQRLGLVHNGRSVAFGVVLGGGAWLVLLALVLLEGLGEPFFSLRVIGGHVRLLIAIPLFFLCETLLDPRMTDFVNFELRSRLVSPHSRPALESEIARVVRWKDSWVPDLLCLAAAFSLAPLASENWALGVTQVFSPAHAVAGSSLAAWWWWHACVPLTRFLVLRWFVRLALWYWFLWRVQRLELDLRPRDPDGVGGLRGLEIVHQYFMPLIAAFAAIESASLAEEIVSGKMPFAELYPIVAIMFGFLLVVFLAPLSLFTPKLRAARGQGIRAFDRFANRYVQQFDQKWLDESASESPLGSADIQSLSDLTNSARDLRTMHLWPVSKRIVWAYAIAVLVPMLPLLLLEYPIKSLLMKIVRNFIDL